MLNLSNFHTEHDALFYESERHYFIRYEDDGDYYVLTVECLTEDRKNITSEDYACSSLSVAIASIEALENGEEI